VVVIRYLLILFISGCLTGCLNPQFHFHYGEVHNHGEHDSQTAFQTTEQVGKQMEDGGRAHPDGSGVRPATGDEIRSHLDNMG